VVSAEAPSLEQALERAVKEGTPYVILDDKMAGMLRDPAKTGLTETGPESPSAVALLKGPSAVVLSKVSSLHHNLNGSSAIGDQWSLQTHVSGEQAAGERSRLPRLRLGRRWRAVRRAHSVCNREPGPDRKAQLSKVGSEPCRYP
jgi:hypothetical protein